VETLKRFATTRKIGFTMLSDKGSALIKAFGLIDVSVPESSSWYGFAKPAIYVIDAKGGITHRFAEVQYTERPDPAAVLDALR
jgi:peroxiredoxin